MDLTERMAAKFWEAFAEGMTGAGVAYPAWNPASPMAQETYRCMRHAAQVLFDALPSQHNIDLLEIGWFDAGDAMKAIMSDLFPNLPMSRDEAVSEMKMKHLPLIQIMAGAASTIHE